MQWTKPDFQEITLNMEVTGYVNTDDDGFGADRAVLPGEKAQQPAPGECTA